MDYSEAKKGLPIAMSEYVPNEVICYRHLKDFKDVRDDVGKTLKDICHNCPRIDELKGQPDIHPIYENGVDSLRFACKHAEINIDLSITCHALLCDTQNEVDCVLSIAERPSEKPQSSYSRHFAVKDKNGEIIRCFIFPS